MINPTMDKSQILNIELELVNRLIGKVSLLQPQDEKNALIEQNLEELLKSDHFQKEREELNHQEVKKEFVNRFLSYGIIHDLLNDFEVEDICINALKDIYIHHAQKGLIPTERKFETAKELDLFVKKLLLFSGRRVAGRIINLELPNLDGRVNIAFSAFGPHITITKAKLSPYSIIDLVNKGSLTYDVAAQLWLYLEGLSVKPANMVIAGGPGVGKTTLLNALFSFVPANERMVIIEDTLELNSFLEESCARLESDADLSLADLVKNSLRMRPERIIIGEVRGEEARDMMTAVNVGKYLIGTIHALTAREAIIRLQNEPMNIPEILVNLIDVFVVLRRFHVGNRVFRVVDEISETSGMEQMKILLSQVYKYSYETDKVTPISPSTVYRDRLAQQSGLKSLEIIDEVRIRSFLLEQLAQTGHTTMKEITNFCRAYNKDSHSAIKSLGFDRDELLGKKKFG